MKYTDDDRKFLTKIVEWMVKDLKKTPKQRESELYYSTRRWPLRLRFPLLMQHHLGEFLQRLPECRNPGDKSWWLYIALMDIVYFDPELWIDKIRRRAWF